MKPTAWSPHSIPPTPSTSSLTPSLNNMAHVSLLSQCCFLSDENFGQISHQFFFVPTIISLFSTIVPSIYAFFSNPPCRKWWQHKRWRQKYDHIYAILPFRLSLVFIVSHTLTGGYSRNGTHASFAADFLLRFKVKTPTSGATLHYITFCVTSYGLVLWL